MKYIKCHHDQPQKIKPVKDRSSSPEQADKWPPASQVWPSPGRPFGLRTSWSGSRSVASMEKVTNGNSSCLSGSRHLPMGPKSYGSWLYLCQQHLRRPSVTRRIFFKCAWWQEAGLSEELEPSTVIFTESCRFGRWRLSLLSLTDRQWQTRSRH